MGYSNGTYAYNGQLSIYFRLYNVFRKHYRVIKHNAFTCFCEICNRGMNRRVIDGSVFFVVFFLITLNKFKG